MISKTVLITGAAQRIGAVIARHLHESGFNVIVHYHHSATEANRLVDELNKTRSDSAHCVQADLLDVSRYDELIDTAMGFNGRLDVLVNNASAFFPALLCDINEDMWDELIGTNLKAPLFLAKSINEHLKKNKGCIVNITDIHGSKPLKRYPVYSVAKSGLIMLTKALAGELAPDVRVNAISPGAVLWPQDMHDALKHKILSRIPMQRHGTPMDIAKTVNFLITKADYITGQIISVDGGRSLYS